jgi:hypothetical protein
MVFLDFLQQQMKVGVVCGFGLLGFDYKLFAAEFDV